MKLRTVFLIIFSLFLQFAFAVEYKIETKVNSLWIATIAPENKTEEFMGKLALQLENDCKKEFDVLIEFYDDKSAIKTAANNGIGTQDEINNMKTHYVGVYWKSPKRHYLSYTIDGVSKQLPLDEQGVKALENKYAEKQASTSSKSSASPKKEAPESEVGFIDMLPVYIILAFFISWIIIILNWKKWQEKPWFDFVIALCMGTLGVQKFREKRYILGVLYFFSLGLFFIGWLFDCIKYAVYLIKGEKFIPKRKGSKDDILPVSNNQLTLSEHEPLPVISSSGIVLQKDEVCHFADVAVYVQIKNVVIGRTSTGGRNSTRIFGVSVSSGKRQTETIRGDVAETSTGQLFITSKRIVFSAMKGAFNKKLTEVTAITPCADCFILQFGEKTYTLKTENLLYACQIIARLLNDIQQ